MLPYQYIADARLLRNLRALRSAMETNLNKTAGHVWSIEYLFSKDLE